MKILFEQPGTLLIIGLLAEAIAIGGVVKTGRKEALIGAVLIPIVVVCLLGLERYVVTEREQVRSAIFAMARDVERNDLAAVLEHLSERFPEGRRQAESEFPRFKFSEVSIKNNLEIEVLPENQPPKAIASFNVVVEVSDSSGLISNRRTPRFVELTLYLEEGQWKVGKYSHADPMQGM